MMHFKFVKEIINTIKSEVANGGLISSNKIIDGFGELFRQISYKKIGTSTVQSRALGAIINGKFVFALPGSPTACKDAWDDILVHQLDNRVKPCNFVELIPRLKKK
mgnify:CR=1 FL=1